ncbi:hypothetical protein H2200_010037 [Cladophialophora chaetospira]|uniref:Nephrocystin 3-like N-terminal domain-containing protein n=1 Tax=Cladophialophora chaetospira TaxID=386627 RepID=A0AA38X280_9EURO|nr:hypothetical protein H2200_010037 [Cladophialophora chaetospira]
MQLLSVDLPSAIKKGESNIAKELRGQKDDTLRVRLLDALAFPEMHERRNMIEGRITDFGDTYRWIFYPPPRNDDYKHHGFVDWLRGDQSIFWVGGKPGSGKSSLMEYICQNLQAGQVGSDHLAAWAAPHPVRVLSFWFFRPATTRLLKSLEGLWRSLCHQNLVGDDNLLRKI